MHEARCLDSSSEISVSSSSILYPAGRSESKWFLSRPSKAEDRERENFPVPNLKHWIKHCQGARFQWSSISTRIYSRTVPLSNYLIRTLGTSPLVEFVARCLLPCVRFRWGVRGQKLWRSNSVAVSCGVARWGSLGRVHVGLVCVNVMYSKAYNLPSPQRANIYIYRPWESLTVRRQYVVFQPHCSQDRLGLLLFVAANAYYEYAYIYIAMPNTQFHKKHKGTQFPCAVYFRNLPKDIPWWLYLMLFHFLPAKWLDCTEGVQSSQNKPCSMSHVGLNMRYTLHMPS